MNRAASFALGFLTAAIIALLIIAKQRSEIRTLLLQPPSTTQPQQEQPPEVKPPQIEAQPSQTSDSDQFLEVLRLRGQISQLRRDLDEAHAKNPQLIYPPPPERWRDSPPLPERWALSYLSYLMEIGADTNHVPALVHNRTRTEATSELTRVGATILADERDFIHAEVHLPILKTGDVITDYFTIYFDTNGRLTSLTTNQRLAGHEGNR